MPATIHIPATAKSIAGGVGRRPTWPMPGSARPLPGERRDPLRSVRGHGAHASGHRWLIPTWVTARSRPARRLEKLSWALRSDTGEVREHNEDFAACYVCDAPEDAWDRPPLFVVADGMGGHAAGEVASRVAVEHMLEQWTSGTPGTGAAALRSAARSANLAVIDAADVPGRKGMGTTVTALSMCGREAAIAHVGDSRAYLLREGSVTQCTTDHSPRRRHAAHEADHGRTGRQTSRPVRSSPAASVSTRSCRSTCIARASSATTCGCSAPTVCGT